MFCCILSFKNHQESFAAQNLLSEEEILSSYILTCNRVHLTLDQSMSISREVLRQSALWGVPVDLGVAIMEMESSFNPEAINPRTGDYGLFQVHYDFWKKHFIRKLGNRSWPLTLEDLYQIDVNIRIGMMIIHHDLILAEGSMTRMIGLYSGRRGDSQRQYVAGVMKNEARFIKYRERLLFQQDRVGMASVR